MKKLFVSVPMGGRTEKDILYSMNKMHKLAEIVFNQKLEMIESYVPEYIDMPSLYGLGNSIVKMADADYYIGISDLHYCSRIYKGCNVENIIAEDYKIEKFLLPLMFVLPPDEAEFEKSCRKELGIKA